jgi:hypothetical protein
VLATVCLPLPCATCYLASEGLPNVLIWQVLPNVLIWQGEQKEKAAQAVAQATALETKLKEVMCLDCR